ncbi:hypothetical protein CFP56_034813 [Quercus suber]|uniref:Uncharacterized protein n=1 Tax=Quercus suber TaxID=58331 RepID=A0AAW0LS51_QUESU
MALEVKKQQSASSSSWSFCNMKCLQIIPSRLSSSSKEQQQQQQRDGKVLSDSDTKQRKPGIPKLVCMSQTIQPARGNVLQVGFTGKGEYRHGLERVSSEILIPKPHANLTLDVRTREPMKNTPKSSWQEEVANTSRMCDSYLHMHACETSRVGSVTPLPPQFNFVVHDMEL